MNAPRTLPALPFALFLGLAACGDSGLEPELNEDLSTSVAPELQEAEAFPEAEAPAVVPRPVRPQAVGQRAAPAEERARPEALPRPVRELVGFRHQGVNRWLDGFLHGGEVTDQSVRLDGIDDELVVPGSTGGAPDEVGELDEGTIMVRFRYDDIRNGDQIPDSLPLFYYGRTHRDTIDRNLLDGLTIYIGHGEIEDPTRRAIYFTVYEDYDVRLCFDSGDISLEPDTWYHYAVTIRPGEHRGYLNGEEFRRHYNSREDIHAFFAHVRDRDRMTIGSGVFGISMMDWHFNGDIAEVKIFDRVLTPDEVAEAAERSLQGRF